MAASGRCAVALTTTWSNRSKPVSYWPVSTPLSECADVPARAEPSRSSGEVTIDLTPLTVHGQPVSLSTKELQVLAVIAAERGEVRSCGRFLAEYGAPAYPVPIRDAYPVPRYRPCHHGAATPSRGAIAAPSSLQRGGAIWSDEPCLSRLNGPITGLKGIHLTGLTRHSIKPGRRYPRGIGSSSLGPCRRATRS
jgi:hypothetical protein